MSINTVHKGDDNDNDDDDNNNMNFPFCKNKIQLAHHVIVLPVRHQAAKQLCANCHGYLSYTLNQIFVGKSMWS